MAFKHLYTLICDEVRQEINHKFFIIGLYTGKMVVPQIPWSHASLAFWVAFDSDRPGEFPFRAKFEKLETGKALAQAMGIINVREPGMGINVLQFRNLQLDAVGTYSLSLSIDGEKEPFLSSIEVILQPQPQPPQGRPLA